MKKYLSLILAIFMLASLISCGNQQIGVVPPDKTNTQTEEPENIIYVHASDYDAFLEHGDIPENATVIVLPDGQDIPGQLDNNAKGKETGIVAQSADGFTWERDDTISEFYDETTFLIDGNEFMAQFAYALLDMPDSEDKVTQLNFRYDTWDYIDITRNVTDGHSSSAVSSYVALSFMGNDALNVPMECVSLRVDSDRLMNNYTDYRNVIVNILGTLPYTIDSEIETINDGADVIIDLFNSVTTTQFPSGADEFDNNRLPARKKVNGVTYSLNLIGSDIFVTASIGDCMLTAPALNINDFIIEGTTTNNTDIITKFGGNVIDWLNYHYEGGFCVIYFNPQIDATREGALITARDIHLGDTKSDVTKAYGVGEQGNFNAGTDEYYPILSAGEKGIMGVQCVTFCRYTSIEGYKLTFYFDGSDELTWAILACN